MKLLYKAIFAIAAFFFIPVATCGAIVSEKIRVGVPMDTPPFAFFDQQLNATRGFCIDLAIMSGKVLGVSVEFYGYDEQKLFKALKEGRIDVVGCTFRPPSQQSEYQLIDTSIKTDRHLFAHNACVTVTCLKDLPHHRIVIDDRDDNRLPVASETEIEKVSANSIEEALTVLNKGGADAYLPPNSLTACYIIQKLGFDNIKQVGMAVESVGLSLAVLKERAELLSELSLALGKIQESEHFQALTEKWFGRDITSGSWDRYFKYILMAVAGLAVFLFFFTVWNIALKRKVDRITGDLMLSEEKYRELIESSPDIIHIISDDGTIQMTNKRSNELLGREKNESPGANLMDVVRPDQKEDMRSFIGMLFENGNGENEFVYRGIGDQNIPVELVATTFYGTHQPGSVAACFARDMRVRKTLEEELIRSERLAIMGQMSAGLAHEINNPLGIISGHAQDLLGYAFDEKTLKDSLDVIADNAKRAGRIVNELLSFSRQKQPARIPVDLGDVVEASLLFVKAECKRKKITVVRDLRHKPLIILGDENQLTQVFVNFLLNAVQAVNEAGKITIHNTTMQNQNGQPMAQVEIQDNGRGIKASDVEKVFQPFYSTKETGFGLGLFISSIIVERHNGEIQVESQEGSGTAIRILLPLNHPHGTQDMRGKQMKGDGHG